MCKFSLKHPNQLLSEISFLLSKVCFLALFEADKEINCSMGRGGGGCYLIHCTLLGYSN